MKSSAHFKLANRFLKSQSGTSTLQMAAIFGALALVVSLIGVPALDQASRDYADNRAYGIDDVVVGSIDNRRSNGNVKRYTIRKSVLDQQ